METLDELVKFLGETITVHVLDLGNSFQGKLITIEEKGIIINDFEVNECFIPFTSILCLYKLEIEQD